MLNKALQSHSSYIHASGLFDTAGKFTNTFDIYEVHAKLPFGRGNSLPSFLHSLHSSWSSDRFWISFFQPN